jgi:hypothetical protein
MKRRTNASSAHRAYPVIAYRNFAQILNTARGTNTAFLFSMQSLPQLLQVGKSFQQDVSSAPGTTMLLQTRDEETAKYFKQASSQVPVQKRTQQLWRKDFLGFENFQKASSAAEREQLEYRALDHHIKNLGKGKMELLMTDPVQGTLHGRLHVRPPGDVRVPCLDLPLFPKLLGSRTDERGAHLRFKDQKLAAPVVIPRRYAKDYDAVVTFLVDGKRGRVAIEYERTPKWSKEYERIVGDLDRDRKVDAFLYLVPNVEMHVFLRHALRATRRPMFVAFAKEFARQPRTAELIDVRTQQAVGLGACLAKAQV